MSVQVKRRRDSAANVAAFVGAQGELIVDTTNNRVTIHDGSTAGGWPAAKLAEVVANTRAAVSDAAYTALSTDRLIAFTALTAARALTLCPAASYPTGTRLMIVDESGNCSATKTIAVAPNGSDLIDGASSYVIEAAYGGVEIESNGSNAWTILAPRPNLQASLVGVGTPPDANNPLSVFGASALFNGTNFSFTVNKAAAANTASVIFEDGFSGRAQMGLNGSDNFSFKVSADGATWKTAIALDATTGAPTFANQRTAVSDAAYAALVTDRLIAYAALTAARVVTLPAAANYPPGQGLVVADESGACSATKTITLARAGADTINGATSAVIATAYGYLALESNGSNAWTIVDSPPRKVAMANATYYVRAVVGNVAISNASPAVASLASHGLQAGDPVVFSILPYRTTVTIAQANPAVVAWSNHGFSAGQPVVFDSTGDLPYGVVAGTTYYVIAAGLSTNSFEISASVGGAALSTAAPTLTFANGSSTIALANASTYLKVGQQVQFATTGSLPTNFAAATTYWVSSVSSTGFTVAASAVGTAISAGSAGSGTQTLSQVGTHYGSASGSLPSGVTAGTVYYVLAAGLTANSFEFSTSAGGSAVNTTSAQVGAVSCATGNDANGGLAQNRAGALLTVQQAVTLAQAIDPSTYGVTVQLADSTYLNNTTIAKPLLGNTQLKIQGDAAYPGNTLVSTTSADCFTIVGGANVALAAMKLQTTTAGHCVDAYQSGTIVAVSAMEFGACAGDHILSSSLGYVQVSGAYVISGSAQYHLCANSGFLYASFSAPSLLDVPAFSDFVFCYSQGNVEAYSYNYAGSATGPRYFSAILSLTYNGGGGANPFPGNSAGSVDATGVYIS